MEEELTVHIDTGWVQGIASDRARHWRGIRYAADPSGEARWRAPRPADSWAGIADATGFGPRCVQPPPPPGISSPLDAPVRFSEDALLVNVTAPVGSAPEGGWPVLFHLHGGGFLGGSALDLGEGTAWADAGVLVVSAQYRLGPLGFLDLSALDDDERDGGIAGLLDQRAALHWTIRNVRAFGGNPDAITLFGGSAGGKSVATLLATPGLPQLVRSAIVSGGGGNLVFTTERAQALTSRMLEELEVILERRIIGVRDLRRVRADALVAASHAILPPGRDTWLWRPALHLLDLPDVPIEAIAAGAAAGLPMIIGNCLHDGDLFAAEPHRTAMLEQLRPNLDLIGGPGRAREILDAYRNELDSDEELAAVAAFGDANYGLPVERLAAAQSTHADVWRYRVDCSLPGASAYGLPPAHHGADCMMAWGLRFPGAPDGPTNDDLVLEAAAEGFADLLRTFVRDGRPPSSWPVYTAPERPVLVVDRVSRIERDPGRAVREVWGDRDWVASTWFPWSAPA